MKDHGSRPTRRGLLPIALGVLLGALVTNLNQLGEVFTWLFNLLYPVLLALGFAIIFNAPMHGFQQLFIRLDRHRRTSAKLRDSISLILAVLLVPALLVLMLRFILPQFIGAVTDVIEIIERNEERISGFFVRLGLDKDVVSARLQDAKLWVTKNITSIASTTLSTVMSVFSGIASTIVSLILSIYMLADKKNIARRARACMHAFLPARYADELCRIVRLFTSNFRTFLSRQCLEAVILGLMILICMLIFRIPYAVSIASMTVLLTLLPYIGSILAFFIGGILIVTASPMKALIFAIIFIVTMQLENNLIYPRVVGKSVGLPAYVTLAAVLIGGSLAGIAGMFFTIPVFSVLYMLLRDIVQRRNAQRGAGSETASPEIEHRDV